MSLIMGAISFLFEKSHLLQSVGGADVDASSAADTLYGIGLFARIEIKGANSFAFAAINAGICLFIPQKRNFVEAAVNSTQGAQIPAEWTIEE